MMCPESGIPKKISKSLNLFLNIKNFKIFPMDGRYNGFFKSSCLCRNIIKIFWTNFGCFKNNFLSIKLLLIR